MSADRHETVRRTYAALSRKDVDGFLAGLHPDVELHELPQIPDTGVFRGYAGARRWFEGTSELVESWEWTPGQMLAESDDTLVVRAEFTMVPKGGTVPMGQTIFHAMRFEDGRAISIQGFLDEDSAFQAAGLAR